MQAAMHIHDQKLYRIAPGWSLIGFLAHSVSRPIDPWEGRGVVFHFSTLGLTAPVGATVWIECAPPDPNDDTQPDATAWKTAEYVDGCDGTKQPAQFQVTNEWHDKVVSVEIALCPECKFYRVRTTWNYTIDPPWNVHVIAEVHSLRTKDV